MNDEIFDRIYQAGRADLNDGIDRALETVRSGVVTAFRALNAIQFAAPWRKLPKNVECA